MSHRKNASKGLRKDEQNSNAARKLIKALIKEQNDGLEVELYEIRSTRKTESKWDIEILAPNDVNSDKWWEGPIGRLPAAELGIIKNMIAAKRVKITLHQRYIKKRLKGMRNNPGGDVIDQEGPKRFQHSVITPTSMGSGIVPNHMPSMSNGPSPANMGPATGHSPWVPQGDDFRTNYQSGYLPSTPFPTQGSYHPRMMSQAPPAPTYSTGPYHGSSSFMPVAHQGYVMNDRDGDYVPHYPPGLNLADVFHSQGYL